MEGTDIPFEDISANPVSRDDLNVIQCAPCPAYTPKPKGKGREATIPNKEESNDLNVIQCAPCPAYTPKPKGKGRDEEATIPNKEESDDLNVIQCAPCPAYTPKPQGEGRDEEATIPNKEESDEYDYESPYWAPADKRTGLLSQLRKLKINSVTQKDIE